jgi:hypothetical protein
MTGDCIPARSLQGSVPISDFGTEGFKVREGDAPHKEIVGVAACQLARLVLVFYHDRTLRGGGYVFLNQSHEWLGDL